MHDFAAKIALNLNHALFRAVRWSISRLLKTHGTNMHTAEKISEDGSWKIVVEAWSVSAVVYSAAGVTTHVYARGSPSWWQRLWGTPAGWDAAKADSVSASGLMASEGPSRLPLASAPLPGSPNNRRNDSEADCRAWTIGGALTFDPGRGPLPDGGASASSLSIVNTVRGGMGSAIRNGETLSVGPVDWPGL
jgi:hypothetical protein